MSLFSSPTASLLPRRINSNGLTLLKDFEKLRLTAYLDGYGNWTIGYGHTGPDVYEGRDVTPAQAIDMLEADLQRAEACVQKNVKVPLSDNQFAALVCFTFNVGCPAFVSSSLLRLLNRGWYEQVPTQLLRWDHVKGQVSGGLYRRREAEATLWRTPDNSTFVEPA